MTIRKCMIFKKTFFSLLLIFTIFNFAFLAYPAAALPADNPCVKYCANKYDSVTNPSGLQSPAGMACLCSRDNPKCPVSDPTCTRHESGIIDRATNWIFYLALVLCPLFILIGAVMYYAAAGDPKNATTGRKIIVYAMIGLAIALLTKLIYAVVRFLIGQ